LVSLEHVEQVPWARDLARRLLAESLPRRWSHTQGVAHKAESIAHIVGDKAALLISAAWLHDIGYAPGLAETGFHPLDGARYLRDSEKTNEYLCRLVAHHSCAIIEARNRGLDDNLIKEFPAVEGPLLDALTYSDMTTSPDGRSVTVETRLAEIASRYGEGVVARSIEEARQRIIHTARTVSSIIAASGIDVSVRC
jgi:Predicted HD superfamily hydrolase